MIEGGQTQSGMTGAQVDALLDDGYEMDEIMLADAIAARHGLTADLLLDKRRKGENWDQIVAWVSREYPAQNQRCWRGIHPEIQQFERLQPR